MKDEPMISPGTEKKPPRIIVVCGPTGVGKTSDAIEMAERIGGEIIGADSMQIYKFMNIGTAKPTPEERARVRHHMVDIVFPDGDFDAARFARQADRAAKAVLEKNRVPIVAGGTGFYIKALLSGLFDAGPADPGARDAVKRELRENGPGFLHDKLARVDPEAAKRIHPNDVFRTSRALEVFYASGRPITERQKAHAFGDRRFDALKIGLNMDREKLYDRINRRVDAMMASGFPEEVRGLFDMGYREDLKSMRAIGYRHMADFIAGRVSESEAVETMKRDTRRYAKTQLTWFKKDPGVIWTGPGGVAGLETAVRRHLDR
ncbi:tRNA dimethylallyltransferase [Candidatus Desulfarcum epimagneticum]|uniref:tRNA dimethylallyltransferase n=1 Tax=uncultured Desulfobacteraceae bacterium TaxID=218296 RepID=A0A484HES9_9BACT|nr:tRNA dimethylallyltransferase [uncultured Desulfobacteraceae bacterium]